MSSTNRPGSSDLARVAQSVGKDWATSDYYERAEKADWLQVFWADRSPFLRFFRELDLTCVLELACGYGRHAATLKDLAQHVILVDINVGNVQFCRQRFKDVPHYRVLLTDGYSFDSVRDGECTAVFSYDAMVHFDSDVVRAYLQDTARVLAPGGRALLHHSNYSLNPGGDVHDNPSWRNFMSQNLFHHYAAKCGMRILASDVIDWDGHPSLDCVTLLERPHGR